MARIHITGGSGSGTTTLGRALAAELGWVHVDADDLYWLPTESPYSEPRPPAERDRAARDVLARTADVVLSGAVLSWDLGPRPFDLVVDLREPRRVRLERLRRRECAELGADAIAPGGSRRAEFVAFLRWAARFDTGDTSIRSRARIDAWLARFETPVLVLEGGTSVAERVARVRAAIAAAAHRG